MDDTVILAPERLLSTTEVVAMLGLSRSRVHQLDDVLRPVLTPLPCGTRSRRQYIKAIVEAYAAARTRRALQEIADRLDVELAALPTRSS